LLGTAALGGETAALPEDALTTAALAYERRAQPPAALAGVPPSALAAGRPPPPPGIAPAHKTGVGGVVPRPRSGSSTRDKLMKGLEQSLALTRDAFKRYTSKQAREEEALKDSFKEALVAMVEAQVKKEGMAVIDKIPFVKVIRVSFELSIAFAGGVGRALEQVNAELANKYDFSRLREELDEEDIRLIQAMRGYQAEATRQLGRIIAEGLGDVAVKATEMVLEKLGEMPGKILNDVAGQIAQQLERRFDILAVFRTAVKEASDSIPEGRRKVEKLAFNFVSGVFLDQMTDKELQGKLKVVIGLGKDFPVEGKLLTSLIKMLMDSSYDTYTKHVDVPYAQAELKQLLLENARKLAAGLVGVRLEASQSGDVEVAPDRIGVPQTWLLPLLDTEETSRLRRDEYWGREKELIDYLQRLKVWLEDRKSDYQRQWRPYARASVYEVYDRLYTKWKKDWDDAFRLADEAVENIVRDFGEVFDNMTVRNHLGQNIRGNLGYKNEFQPFARFP
jgi:hypothetical protein